MRNPLTYSHFILCGSFLTSIFPPKLFLSFYERENKALMLVLLFRQVFKPTQARFIRVFEHVQSSQGMLMKQVLALDTATSPDVHIRQHPLSSNQTRYQLTFTITTPLEKYSMHSIMLDSGTVVGVKSCTGGGVPFTGLNNRNTWTFSTTAEG